MESPRLNYFLTRFVIYKYLLLIIATCIQQDCVLHASLSNSLNTRNCTASYNYTSGRHSPLDPA